MGIYLSNSHNELANKVLERLSNPDNWNQTGGRVDGKSCIVMCAWDVVINGEGDKAHYMKEVCKSIKRNFGLSRGIYYVDLTKPDIIFFNDHEDTTHEDLMLVLTEAEKATRPIWRKFS